MTVRALARERGKKQGVYLPLTKRADGSEIHLPVLVVSGKTAGPTLVIDAGVHGDELEGIEAVLLLYQKTNPADLKGTLIIVPALNIPAFNDGMRIEFSDQKYMAYTAPDMNRVYPGNPSGSMAERIVNKYVTEVLDLADYYISFHGGGNMGIIGPFTGFGSIEAPNGKESLQLCKAFGFEMIWQTGDHGATSTTYARKANVPSMIVEVGGDAMRWPSRSFYLDHSIEGMTRVMKQIGMLDGEVECLPSYKVVALDYFKANNGGFLYQQYQLGAKVKKGDLLWTIVGLDGTEVDHGYAAYDGEVCGVRTYPKVQPGDWIVMLAEPIVGIS